MSHNLFLFAIGSKRHGEEICFLVRLSKFQRKILEYIYNYFQGLSNFGIVEVSKMKAVFHCCPKYFFYHFIV